MRLKFLLATAWLMLLLFSSCQKEELLSSNIDSQISETDLIQKAYANLSPYEKQFFDPTFLSSNLEDNLTSGNQAITRDELHSSVQMVLDRMMILNYEQPFVLEVMNDFGYAAWDNAFVEETTNNDGQPVNIVHIPFAFSEGKELSAYLLATVDKKQHIEFALVEKSLINSIVESNNIEFDVTYHAIVFLKLNKLIFGDFIDGYISWLKLFNENNLQSEGAVTREGCWIRVYVCVPPHYALNDPNQSTTRDPWDCSWQNIYVADCSGDGSDGTGTGTGSVGNGTTSTSPKWGTKGGGSTSTNPKNTPLQDLIDQCFTFMGQTGDEGPDYTPIQLDAESQSLCGSIDFLQSVFPNNPEVIEIFGNIDLGLLNTIAGYLQLKEGVYYRNLILTYAKMLSKGETYLGLKAFEKLYDKVDGLRQILGLDSSEVLFLLNKINVGLADELIGFINNNNFQFDNTEIEVSNIHIDLLMTDSDYVQLNKDFSTADPILWAILKEMGKELAIALVKKYADNYSNLDEIINAVDALLQGDIKTFLGECLEIAKGKIPVYQAAQLAITARQLQKKASRIYGKLKGMLATLGSEKFEKIWTAISKNINILEDFKVDGGNKGLQIWNKTSGEFFDDLKDAFGVTTTSPDGQNNGGVYFQYDNLYFVYYPNSTSTGGPTVEVRICKTSSCSGAPTGSNSNDIYKFRWP